MRLFIVLIGFVLLSACNNAPVKQDDTPKQQAVLEKLPMEAIQLLQTKCNNIDFIYYALSVSTNLEGDNARSGLNYFGDQIPPTINCSQPFANLTFTGDGEILMTAEAYFAQNCTYLTFTYNNKQYHNMIAEQGVSFFNKVIQMSQGKK